MPCELIQCCQFFSDNMKNLPKSAAYIKKKLCEGDFASCNRYRIFREFNGQSVPPYLTPSDLDEVAKAMRCLEKKLGRK